MGDFEGWGDGDDGGVEEGGGGSRSSWRGDYDEASASDLEVSSFLPTFPRLASRNLSKCIQHSFSPNCMHLWCNEKCGRGNRLRTSYVSQAAPVYPPRPQRNFLGSLSAQNRRLPTPVAARSRPSWPSLSLQRPTFRINTPSIAARSRIRLSSRSRCSIPSLNLWPFLSLDPPPFLFPFHSPAFPPICSPACLPSDYSGGGRGQNRPGSTSLTLQRTPSGRGER